MRSAAACPDFDALALAKLLNASFAAWHVTATARASQAAALAVQVRRENGCTLQVVRVDEGGRGLPAWCHGPLDMPLDGAPRAASLGALLVELRMQLDGDYVPHPPVMGAQRLAAP